jgi:hypothetical protein
MAFTETITLAGDASSSTAYALSYRQPGKSVRRVESSDLANPKYLTISHQESGNGNSLVDRHMVRIDMTSTNAEGVSATFSIYTVLVVPRVSEFTVAQMQDAVTQLTGFLQTDANTLSLLNALT